MIDLFSLFNQASVINRVVPGKKVAFVIPWYGPNIPGGAEKACKELAENLAMNKIPVEILTTCARDFYSWDNFHEETVTEIHGVPVRRFKTRERNVKVFDQLNSRILEGDKLSLLEEYQFINEIINSDNLYRFIAQYRENYLFFFTPYMFGTSYWGGMICPANSFLLPCCHEEGYLHLSIYKHLFNQVKDVCFYSLPEKKLVEKYFNLGDKGKILGLGISDPPGFEKGVFRKTHGITSNYILYMGRKQPEKNTHLLVEYFTRFDQNNDLELKLVFIGSGQLPDNFKKCPNIVDIGFVTEEEKYDAIQESVCVCQPSSRESFSFVIMEAWMMKTPVLVNEECDVTVDHCRRSNGGLYFSNYDEFNSCLNTILSNTELRLNMGQNGYKYLRENFTWPIIIDRFIQLTGIEIPT